ncbi:MAG: thioredoxin family protein [Candidatus Wallbacteria bacterium]|nr:thioredoxin family protein [Candidatus Wallbacteria bacterium]
MNWKNVATPLLLAALVAAAPIALRAEEAESKNVKEIDASTKSLDIDKLVEPGHTTIVDIFSQACPPCRALSPKLDALAKKRKGLKILKLNLGTKQSKEGLEINWDVPLRAKYDIHSIPYLFLYDEKGVQLAAGEDAYSKVLGWLKKEKLAK